MNFAHILQQSGAIDNIAGQLGIDKTIAHAGASALLPAILGGFKKTTEQGGGVDGLGGILSQLGGSGLLESVLGPQETPIEQGNNVLGQIFGSKDVSRSVAGHASQQTGVDSSILKKMLPMLAMVVGGYMANQQGGAQAQQQSGGGLGGLLGGLLGGSGGSSASGIASMLDLDGDGNPLDDIIGIASKFAR
ncbi:DUF937 domain-containing protein [Alterisphingorhabdus coralli]|uniref:DUF937 domain-containing protein n=1 Tax=Alterisphingorhabdus coralli TaxID=3071408 RepID=A0AA97HZV6_9SPHN|nr:DUF937 domain-containing protein [Parasphingorhabdus sp. SCSIO 66989]WOE73803.1 DUF937 domain-containing protein [Parasphingorhabdus sp. SCSIO 66989]